MNYNKLRKKLSLESSMDEWFAAFKIDETWGKQSAIDLMSFMRSVEITSPEFLAKFDSFAQLKRYLHDNEIEMPDIKINIQTQSFFADMCSRAKELLKMSDSGIPADSDTGFNEFCTPPRRVLNIHTNVNSSAAESGCDKNSDVEIDDDEIPLDLQITSLRNQKFVLPSGIFTVQLMATYMCMHCESGECTVYYDDINGLYHMPMMDGGRMAFVISLEKPIQLGNQKYQNLVLETNKLEHTLAVNLTSLQISSLMFGHGNLTPVMCGPNSELIRAVLFALTSIPVVKSRDAHCIRCSIKANDGLLYPLAKSFIFINKPCVILRNKDIEYAEFKRYEPAANSENNSFDLVIYLKDTAASLQQGDGGASGSGGKEYAFMSIDRSEYASLFDYLNSKEIRVKNPVEVGPAAADEDEVGGCTTTDDAADVQESDSPGGHSSSAAEEDDTDDGFDEDSIPTLGQSLRRSTELIDEQKHASPSFGAIVRQVFRIAGASLSSLFSRKNGSKAFFYDLLEFKVEKGFVTKLKGQSDILIIAYGDVLCIDKALSVLEKNVFRTHSNTRITWHLLPPSSATKVKRAWTDLPDFHVRETDGAVLNVNSPPVRKWRRVCRTTMSSLTSSSTHRKFRNTTGYSKLHRAGHSVTTSRFMSTPSFK